MAPYVTPQSPPAAQLTEAGGGALVSTITCKILTSEISAPREATGFDGPNHHQTTGQPEAVT